MLTLPSYTEAHTSFPALAVTPVREFRTEVPSWSDGVGTMLQALPFQCAARVFSKPTFPTAHASFAAMVVMADPKWIDPGGEGDVATVHALPFQCANSIRIWLFGSSCAHPVAQMSLEATPSIPMRTSAELAW